MDVIKLNPFLGVAPGGLATLVTDQLNGMSVHAIVFKQGHTLGAFTKAHMTSMKIRGVQKDLLPADTTGAKLQSMNSYDGFADTTNYTIHYFGDPMARTIRGQHLGDLDMSVYPGPLEIKVGIDAAASADSTLSCLAVVGPPKKAMGIGFNDADALTVRAIINSTIQEAAAVTRKAEPIGLGSGAGARIRKIAFFHANLVSVEYKKQGIVKFEDLLTADNSAIVTDLGRVPQAGLYVLDRIPDGNQGEADDTIQPNGQPWNLQLLITTSAADTIPVFADVHTMPTLL